MGWVGVPAGACADFYNLQIRDTLLNQQVDIAWPDGAATSYTVPAGKLTPGRTYTWWIWAHNAVGFGPAGVASFTVSAGGLLQPLPPARILDTRRPQDGPAVGPGELRPVQVAGRGGVPPTGVSAVVLNVTVTNPSAASYLTVFPAGVGLPTASNLNFLAGQTVPNRVIVPLGAGGGLDLYNAVGTVDVVIDVNGWFTDGSTVAGSRLSGLPPSRIFDSRQRPDAPAIGPGETRSIQVAGQGGVPASGATAVVLNVTVTNPTAASYLTVFPGDAALPVASDLNWTAGETVPNLVVVKLGADGTVNVYNPAGSVDVIVDVVGYFG